MFATPKNGVIQLSIFLMIKSTASASEIDLRYAPTAQIYPPVNVVENFFILLRLSINKVAHGNLVHYYREFRFESIDHIVPAF